MENHYELLYIVSIKHIEEDLQKVRDAVKKLVADNGGTSIVESEYVRQRLAYPIKHVHQGTYVVAEFDLPREGLKEIDKQITLMPEVLRHLTVKKRVSTPEEDARVKQIQVSKAKVVEGRANEEKAAAAEAAQKEQDEKNKAADAEEKEDASEEKPVKEEDSAKEEKSAEKDEVEVKKKPEKEKATLEDLDKKLDEILTEEIL